MLSSPHFAHPAHSVAAHIVSDAFVVTCVSQAHGRTFSSDASLFAVVLSSSSQ
jgi:hypothetical protein